MRPGTHPPTVRERGLGFGLGFWLLLGLFQGVSGETIGDPHRVVPNQGIHRSARNSLVFGLISTAIVWLIFPLSDGLGAGLTGLSYGLSSGLSVGLSAGLLAGLLNGGLACLRHYRTPRPKAPEFYSWG